LATRKNTSRIGYAINRPNEACTNRSNGFRANPNVSRIQKPSGTSAYV